jgi:hypothetical protein
MEWFCLSLENQWSMLQEVGVEEIHRAFLGLVVVQWSTASGLHQEAVDLLDQILLAMVPLIQAQEAVVLGGMQHMFVEPLAQEQQEL